MKQLLTTIAALVLVGCGSSMSIHKAAGDGNIEAVKQYLDGGADVNAGLLLVEPSHTEYNEMIKELTSPVETWMGPDKEHKGFYSFDFDSVDGRKFIENSYCYPEQNYLTKRFSGQWKYIEFSFQSLLFLRVLDAKIGQKIQDWEILIEPGTGWILKFKKIF